LKLIITVISLIAIFLIFSVNDNFNVFAEEKTVTIPFGASNPELNTPAEVWYDPPIISVNPGDTVTWINDDTEGHTATSGKGPGRFGWMNPNQASFGDPDGIFDSARFLPGESWSYTFEETGSFSYFCTFHPWMEGAVIVNDIIPNYPHDYLGNKVEFPINAITPDRSIKVSLSWDPPVLKTFEKAKFIYHFHDVATDQRLLNQKYDIILIQNGKEIFRDDCPLNT